MSWRSTIWFRLQGRWFPLKSDGGESVIAQICTQAILMHMYLTPLPRVRNPNFPRNASLRFKLSTAFKLPAAYHAKMVDSEKENLAWRCASAIKVVCATIGILFVNKLDEVEWRSAFGLGIDKGDVWFVPFSASDWLIDLPFWDRNDFPETLLGHVIFGYAHCSRRLGQSNVPTILFFYMIKNLTFLRISQLVILYVL